MEKESVEKEIVERLFALQDLKYRDFQTRLIPNIDSNRIIGVRTPDIRKLAKEIGKAPASETYLTVLPHYYFDENNLHSFLLDNLKDFNQALTAVDAFLPYDDNWATCDQMSPKVFKKHRDELYPHIVRWVHTDQTYTIRFGIGMLMRFYLDESFVPAYLDLIAEIKSTEYYVNMMIAWFFATALAKQYESTFPLIQSKHLEKWTHNKTIQKAIESYRISAEQKAELRALKI